MVTIVVISVVGCIGVILAIISLIQLIIKKGKVKKSNSALLVTGAILCLPCVTYIMLIFNSILWKLMFAFILITAVTDIFNIARDTKK